MSRSAGSAANARRTLSATDGATCRMEWNSLAELTRTWRSVAAVAVPVLLYMALALLKGKPTEDDEL